MFRERRGIRSSNAIATQTTDARMWNPQASRRHAASGEFASIFCAVVKARVIC
jgi:hypothetical protein